MVIDKVRCSLVMYTSLLLLFRACSGLQIAIWWRAYLWLALSLAATHSPSPGSSTPSRWDHTDIMDACIAIHASFNVPVLNYIYNCVTHGQVDCESASGGVWLWLGFNSIYCTCNTHIPWIDLRVVTSVDLTIDIVQLACSMYSICNHIQLCSLTFTNVTMYVMVTL